MTKLDDATLASLVATFLDESFEGLARAEAGLLQLETAATPELVGDLFRAIHSIKGGAGAFGVVEIGDLAHAMESVLDDVRNGGTPTRAIVAGLLAGVDQLRRALSARVDGSPVNASVHAPLVAKLVGLRGSGEAAWLIEFAPHAGLMQSGNDPLRILRELVGLGGTVVNADLSKVPPLAELDPTSIYLAWTIRVPGTVARADIDEAFAWVIGDCELAIAREAAVQVAAQPSAPVATSAGTNTLRVGVDKIDLLMNMVGELVITQSILGELDDGPIDAERAGRIREGLSLLARNTRALQESVVRLRSMPVGVVFARLPRLVHDLGVKLGKDVGIELVGETTELDKTVLEKIGDPLVHIIRNSIDHGLETPAEREATGKPRRGTITVRAEHRGSAVVIEVIDDGRGLDRDRILAVARRRGVVAADAQLSDDEVAQLIFAPGFSTAREVSEVSGRGVGMDVVWRSIKELRGEVRVASQPGRGLRVTLSLPLTLAIVDGQLLRLADEIYVIPLLAIVETVEIDPSARRRFGDGSVIRIRDEVIPMIDLAATLGLRATRAADARLLMIVEADGTRLGLVVDELLAQQQVVIKSLETNYGRVDGLAGATILGDGRVAFILDVVALARHVRRTGRAAA